jgi:hypothetical protein
MRCSDGIGTNCVDLVLGKSRPTGPTSTYKQQERVVHDRCRASLENAQLKQLNSNAARVAKLKEVVAKARRQPCL